MTSHALLIGGSLGGMFAARVLAEHFDKVTVLDRDSFPEKPEHRSGVPQSHHAHGLLARGQLIIEALFPGIMQDMQDAGAAAGGRLEIVSPVGKLAPVNLEQGGTFVSRFLLEWHVRRRLEALDNVVLQEDVEVTELLSSADRERVTGVKVYHRKGHGAEALLADLVVDASGRHSKAPEWLSKLGYNAPPEESINSGIGYASRFYEKPNGFPADWAGIIINGRAPDNPRAGLILPIEDDKWHVTVGGYAEHYPPGDEEGFLAWAKALPDPSIYEAVRVAKPLSPIRLYRTPTNRLRRFEKLKRQPKGLIFTGDSVCAFNPIYGQGMTTSALDAEVLQATLRQTGYAANAFEKRFQRNIARAVAAPWFIATGEDLRWEGVGLTGSRRVETAFVHRYVTALLSRARTDPVVSRAYFATLHMLCSPVSCSVQGSCCASCEASSAPTYKMTMYKTTYTLRTGRSRVRLWTTSEPDPYPPLSCLGMVNYAL